jgi:hypothetical protein
MRPLPVATREILLPTIGTKPKPISYSLQARGIAFVAQDSADGTWHGYPEPWNKIPAALKDKWLTERKMTVRDLRRYSDFPKDNIAWALEVDDE